VTNKARENEAGILRRLELAVATTLQVDLGELEERWKSELLDRHKEELMQNQQYRMLPEPMKTVDSFASTAIASASRTERAAAAAAAAVAVVVGGETDGEGGAEGEDDQDMLLLSDGTSTTDDPGVNPLKTRTNDVGNRAGTGA
jgi:hypothetical protein